MENDITSLRIPKNVKEELKELSLNKEPLHLTIQRLIEENRHLKKINEKNEELIDLYKEKIEKM